MPDCFVATCDPDKMTTTDNINQICQPNANVGQIQTKIDNLNACINDSFSKKGDLCKDCAQNHTQLENHLEQLISKGAGVCFEIIDMVNCNFCCSSTNALTIIIHVDLFCPLAG